jgi:hypothetical protein
VDGEHFSRAAVRHNRSRLHLGFRTDTRDDFPKSCSPFPRSAEEHVVEQTQSYCIRFVAVARYCLDVQFFAARIACSAKRKRTSSTTKIATGSPRPW